MIHSGVTDVEPAAFEDLGFVLWLSLHVPGLRTVNIVDDGLRVVGIIVHTDAFQATAHFATESGHSRVLQDGRRLWDTVDAAWHAWQRNGRPTRERLGITARADGNQRAWLDSPDSAHSWPLPV